MHHHERAREAEANGRSGRETRPRPQEQGGAGAPAFLCLGFVFSNTSRETRNEISEGANRRYVQLGLVSIACTESRERQLTAVEGAGAGGRRQRRSTLVPLQAEPPRRRRPPSAPRECVHGSSFSAHAQTHPSCSSQPRDSSTSTHTHAHNTHAKEKRESPSEISAVDNQSPSPPIPARAPQSTHRLTRPSLVLPPCARRWARARLRSGGSSGGKQEQEQEPEQEPRRARGISSSFCFCRRALARRA